MIQVSASEIIDAPVADVFHKMSRLETLPEWLVGCEKAWAVSDDPYSVGGRVAHIDSVMGQTFEAHYEVDGRPGVQREESAFVRENRTWYYVGEAAAR